MENNIQDAVLETFDSYCSICNPDHDCNHCEYATEILDKQAEILGRNPLGKPTPDAILSDARGEITFDKCVAILHSEFGFVNSTAYTDEEKPKPYNRFYKVVSDILALHLAAVREKVESVPTNYDSQVFGKGMGRDKTAKEFKQAILKLFGEGE